MRIDLGAEIVSQRVSHKVSDISARWNVVDNEKLRGMQPALHDEAFQPLNFAQ